ncbi:alpha/beta fold hydrolase [Kineococcus radiotolerans]|uniref:Alpha/beta hydrolase fold n=1 Tax=Kineococcus radiotolerans (strain ATCC BAA-149 / DSM 14245 / SRS30216) TaxID=266940 RepID=A6WA65_KINRD|nr:alpha/beta hydrolase [Kineococcus radiotolerans]ABS03704.1 alpha/beta hydrolase fold [Kineococcus radiotolerans SRS30216 = ATCC BAA-149]
MTGHPTQHLHLDEGTLAYDLTGEGPLVVLAHGMGDSRHSYRHLAPALIAAGYRVADLDLRGCGESSLGWTGYSRTDIAGDLIALVRHLTGTSGERAVLVGHSISGGAATIAATTTPELIAGLVELAPFTRKQSTDVRGLLHSQRYRSSGTLLGKTLLLGSLPAWMNYLELAYPTKPTDWAAERTRIEATMSEPGRMKVLQAMAKSSAADAGAHLPNVRCPVLIVQGSLDPDWADPRAEGERVLAELPAGLGQLALIDGGGHYLHAQVPEQLLPLILPFLARTLTRA